jgi:septal ring-binding cell division protein DamX
MDTGKRNHAATLDRDNVQTIFQKEQIQSVLSLLIMQCDMNNINFNSQPHVLHTAPLMEELATRTERNTATTTAPSKTTMTATTMTKAMAPNMEDAEEGAQEGVLPVAQTPVPLQCPSVFAGMYMAGSHHTSSLSGVSSLTGKMDTEIRRSQRLPQVRLSSLTALANAAIGSPDYNSDACETEDEHKYQVDFTENFWQQRQEERLTLILRLAASRQPVWLVAGDRPGPVGLPATDSSPA